MHRLLFEKKAPAIWISHLDLMRLFQRAFKRAGLPLTHTQGFTPRPSVSIALPLSVGVESDCEILSFELDTQEYSDEEICRRLNEALVAGICVKSVYTSDRKLRELTHLRCLITLEYDRGVPQGAQEAIRALFSRTELCVERKAKGAVQTQDIAPMIRSIKVSQEDDTALAMDAVICCQNPTLNPALMLSAVAVYLPQYAPDFGKCRRLELYDAELTVFR